MPDYTNDPNFVAPTDDDWELADTEGEGEEVFTEEEPDEIRDLEAVTG